MFLGGRNLGDHYLTDSKDSFLDGDVMLCRHQGAKIAYTFDSAKASFEELKHDLEDPILTASSDNTVHEIPADPNFVFKHLIFPRGAALSGTRTERYRGSLPESARTLGEMRLWADTYNVPAFITLDASDNWRFLKAGWDPSRDEVQASLLDLIRNERKELFIETPYAEFDATLRKALEDAMARGVRVHLITNSFFMSDGFSRVIRITMANWMRKTLAAYPENFRVRYVTYDAGHMTHFKGAAFTCQRSGLKTVRTFLLGSHNFDPRSGRSDKDHAVMWDEPSDCSSLAQMPAVSGRNAFYAHLSQKLNIPVLAPYSDFGQELQNVSKLYKKSEPTRLMAQALMRVFYVNTQNGYVLNQASKVEYLLQLMDDGGLHDLFGRVL
jgi:phosphatidylserine/phosphatidylglycerophosphate/cardiolipin synthase-like enzyme